MIVDDEMAVIAVEEQKDVSLTPRILLREDGRFVLLLSVEKCLSDNCWPTGTVHDACGARGRHGCSSVACWERSDLKATEGWRRVA